LKKEFAIEDEWLSLEIHPETPAEGVLLADKFKGANMDAMYDNLRHAGAPYGIEFGKMTKLSNSRMALEASEFARDHGKYDEFHGAIFHAYFTEARDIGSAEVVLGVAKQVGLDTDELQKALADGRYLPRLQEAQEEAYQYGISGTPTFIINGRYKVYGAQPLDAFRNALQRIEAEGEGQ
jgi:predicted DsbA family dithiol-disulfide isomerase